MSTTSNLGYPRIGQRRELKWALERYWRGTTNANEVLATAAEIRCANWITQRDAGIESIPSNDFSLYDQMLDMSVLLGAVPPRYGWDGGTIGLDLYFAMARGAQDDQRDVSALEMTKWFDTNYHYLVPELRPDQTFSLSSSKPVDEFLEAKALGIVTRPVLIGPVSYLLLSKVRDTSGPIEWFDTLATLLEPLTEVYAEVIARLVAAGAEWIQFDEPCFVQDRGLHGWAALQRAYSTLAERKGNARLLVQTYFGHVGESYPTLVDLPADAVGLDFVRGAANLDLIAQHGFPEDKLLAAGVVDGRNVWRNDLVGSLDILERIARDVPAERLFVSPSCSLLHVPQNLDYEPVSTIRPELRSWMAFARQKLDEVVALRRGLDGGREAIKTELAISSQVRHDRQASPLVRRPKVRERLAGVSLAEERRASPAVTRRNVQQAMLNLPPFPTTTIGSFPQTPEVRRARTELAKGEITQEQYDDRMRAQIAEVVRLQEELGLDVLVHGEFERNDMVQYFGEQLKGFAFTQHGWVQSYGSRCVRPPIIFGDVDRPRPMTVRWSSYAQSLTKKPVKGMLTGPVTILNWSFVRDDQPRSETARMVALALRDEVADLEAAGIKVIQVDEPALREGLPLRVSEWDAYLDWTVLAFRLATSGVLDTTQIHTHMCYCDFNDVIEAISDLDADVISIENSRSDLELLAVFNRFRYDKGIGPGVYDIHSPRVPPVEEMANTLHAATTVLDRDLLWVNPDCGLKTRGYPETTAALRNMVRAAGELRVQPVGAGRPS